MGIPEKVSAVVDVIYILSINTTSVILVLSKRWYLPGLALI